MHTNKTKVKRIPKRGHYDKETIYQILDDNYLCHVGFIHDGYPVVIPTGYARKEEYLYLHGSMASRMMKNLSQGVDISICVTKLNALVLAKSGFHHSMNYQSVVLFGKATLIEDFDEKIKAMDILVDHIIPGRTKEVRPHKSGEIKGTMMLRIKIDEASAKIRDEGASDDPDDKDLDIWSGVVPIHHSYGKPVAQEEGREMSKALQKLISS